MAVVTLIKEDGTGKSDANSYAHLDDGEIYHRGLLYSSAWDAATDDDRTEALVMATRLIDAEYQFHGYSAKAEQALSWPRQRCPDPDELREDGDGYLPSDAVPKRVRDATCEMARELLVLDRTASHPGEGLKYQNVGSDQTGYDKSDTRPIISYVAQAMLAKYGVLVRSKSGSVKLQRS
jgi:hypothetical protein